MRVNYRIHKYDDVQGAQYIVEEEFATNWIEVRYYGVRLIFHSAQGAIAFIRALHSHTGEYSDEELLAAMVTN